MFFNKNHIAPFERRQTEWDKYRYAFEYVMHRPGVAEQLGVEMTSTITNVIGRMVLVQPDETGVIEFPVDVAPDAVAVLPVLHSEDTRGYRMGSGFNVRHLATEQMLRGQGYEAVSDDETIHELARVTELYQKYGLISDDSDLTIPRENSAIVVSKGSHAYKRDDTYVYGANTPLMVLFPPPKYIGIDAVSRGGIVAHEGVHVMQNMGTALSIDPIEYLYQICQMEEEAYNVQAITRVDTTFNEKVRLACSYANRDQATSIKLAKQTTDGQKLPFIRALNGLGVLQVPVPLLDELEDWHSSNGRK